jgi:hypothetical protein
MSKGCNKQGKFVICAALLIFMIFSVLPADIYAASSMRTSKEVKEYVTGPLDYDNIKVSISGEKMNVKFYHRVDANLETQFAVSKGYNDGGFYSSDRVMTHRFRRGISKDTPGVLEANLDFSGLSNGKYNLIVKCNQNGRWTNVVRQTMIKVYNGQPSILVYDSILAHNKSKQRTKNYSRNKYTSLSDLKGLLYTDPVTNILKMPTKSQITYYKKISSRVVADAKNDYEKMEKIYKYVCDNYYYDRVAYETKKLQYDNPYKNLYNLNNKKTSPNSQDGRVATTCNGYSGLVTALGRAQGIPCRIAYGHRAHNDVSEEKSFNKNHFWVEAYIKSEGRWITIDSTRGTDSLWDKKGKKWTKAQGLDRMNRFDISDEALANEYYILGYYYSK